VQLLSYSVGSEISTMMLLKVEVLRRVDWSVVSEVLKGQSALILRAKESRKAPEDRFTLKLQALQSIDGAVFPNRHGVTSHETWMSSHTVSALHTEFSLSGCFKLWRCGRACESEQPWV
jgi:hypothetical protein